MKCKVDGKCCKKDEGKVKVKQSLTGLLQAQRVPGGWGSQIYKQSAHEGGKVVSLNTGRLYSSGNIPGTHFCYRLSQPHGQSAAGRFNSMTNPDDTVGNRPRDLPAAGTVLERVVIHYPNFFKKVYSIRKKHRSLVRRFN